MLEILWYTYSPVKFFFHLKYFPIHRGSKTSEGRFFRNYFLKFTVFDFTKLGELIKQKWTFKADIVSMRNHYWFIYCASNMLCAEKPHPCPMVSPSSPWGEGGGNQNLIKSENSSLTFLHNAHLLSLNLIFRSKTLHVEFSTKI